MASAELYPDKPIYDIPGFPVCGAQELPGRYFMGNILLSLTKD